MAVGLDDAAARERELRRDPVGRARACRRARAGSRLTLGIAQELGELARSARRRQKMEWPPSIESTWPVTHDDSSATKKRTPLAMSSGVPEPARRDPLEQRAAGPPRRSSPTARSIVGFERTKPGAIALTVIPNGPSSCAVWRVKPIWPAFALA